MTTHNEITGDRVVSGKGSAEKYAEGWESIFGPKTLEPGIIMDADRVTVMGSNGKGMLFNADGSMTFTNVSSEEVDAIRVGWENALGRIMNQKPPKIGDESCREPTAVMALDFHDSVAVKENIFERLSRGFDAIREDRADNWQAEAGQAREDAWRDAVMRGKYKGEDIG